MPSVGSPRDVASGRGDLSQGGMTGGMPIRTGILSREDGSHSCLTEHRVASRLLVAEDGLQDCLWDVPRQPGKTVGRSRLCSSKVEGHAFSSSLFWPSGLLDVCGHLFSPAGTG